MGMTDPIADMIVRIKTAIMRSKEVVDLPSSNLKAAVAQVLFEEGYIKKFEVLPKGNKKILRLRLKYGLDQYGKIKNSAISYLKRVSRPGSRVYKDAKSIFRLRGGFGTSIVSTSKGLMTNQKAKAQKLGGEVILEVW